AMSLALATVIGFSAFKATESNKQTERVLAFNAATDQYEEVANYNSANCEPGEQICSYKTDSTQGDGPGQVPVSISLEDLSTYLHLMEANGPDKSQYDFGAL